MKNAMSKVLAHSGMSNSTNKLDPVECRFCGKDGEQMQVKHPFLDEMRWVSIACQCEADERQRQKDEQATREKRARISKALKLSSAMEDIKSMSFQNFYMRDGARSSYDEVVSAVKNFDERKRQGVFIFGETGNGKSHLTAAGGNELIKRGYAVIYITEKDLFNRLKATNNFKNPETFSEIMNACLDADLLIWDDFMSSQKISDDEKDWIFQIINGRERANKPIWMTTNLTSEEFQSERIAYVLDNKGRTWWRIIGNMNCIYNQAMNYRRSAAMSKALGVTIEEYEMNSGGNRNGRENNDYTGTSGCD